MNAAIDTLVPETSCNACGGSEMHAAKVRSAFFEGERLVVVEDIPALVCDGCGGHFYDDATAVFLDLLRGEGFPPERARTELRVPVFSFGERSGAKDPR